MSISDTMALLHQNGIVHGHLHLNNILLDQNFNIIISDIGFNSLKKVSSLRCGYINKGYYTAPENLETKF